SSVDARHHFDDAVDEGVDLVLAVGGIALAGAEQDAADLVDAHRLALREVAVDTVAQGVDLCRVIAQLALLHAVEALAGGALESAAQRAGRAGELLHPRVTAGAGDHAVAGLLRERVLEPVECRVDDAHVIALADQIEAHRPHGTGVEVARLRRLAVERFAGTAEEAVDLRRVVSRLPARHPPEARDHPSSPPVVSACRIRRGRPQRPPPRPAATWPADRRPRRCPCRGCRGSSWAHPRRAARGRTPRRPRARMRSTRSPGWDSAGWDSHGPSRGPVRSASCRAAPL